MLIKSLHIISTIFLYGMNKINLLLLLCIHANLCMQSQIDTLVDVGNYKLHFHIIKGKGTPILFESGNGDDASVWKDLLVPLHTATGATLLTYDRAGLGSSGIDTADINLLNEIIGLERGLKNLGFTGPVFIVTHSFGSYYTTLYTSRNGKSVKGCVFIDALLPCYFTGRKAKETRESIRPEDWMMIKKEAIGLYYVLHNLDEIHSYMQDKKIPETVPVTVIGADIPPKIVKENEQAEWKECQRAFGSWPNHRYVLAEKCEHKVWKNNPDLVINEIVVLYNNNTKQGE